MAALSLDKLQQLYQTLQKRKAAGRGQQPLLPQIAALAHDPSQPADVRKTALDISLLANEGLRDGWLRQQLLAADTPPVTPPQPPADVSGLQSALQRTQDELRAAQLAEPGKIQAAVAQAVAKRDAEWRTSVTDRDTQWNDLLKAAQTQTAPPTPLEAAAKQLQAQDLQWITGLMKTLAAHTPEDRGDLLEGLRLIYDLSQSATAAERKELIQLLGNTNNTRELTQPAPTQSTLTPPAQQQDIKQLVNEIQTRLINNKIFRKIGAPVILSGIIGMGSSIIGLLFPSAVVNMIALTILGLSIGIGVSMIMVITFIKKAISDTAQNLATVHRQPRPLQPLPPFAEGKYQDPSAIYGGAEGRISLSDHAAALTDKGVKRTSNEDSAVIEKDPTSGIILLGAYDGMGGHGGGEIASGLAIYVARTYFHEALGGFDPSQALNRAHNAIVTLVNSDPQKYIDSDGRSMGSCATIAAVNPAANEAILSHSGDARIMLFRNNRLFCLTRDQSLCDQSILAADKKPSGKNDQEVLQQFIAAGEDLSRKYYDGLNDGLPHRNVINTALGMPHPYFENTKLALQPGDLLILCSDGITDFLPFAELKKALINTRDQDLDNVLTEIARALGNRSNDNFTVTLYRHK